MATGSAIPGIRRILIVDDDLHLSALLQSKLKSLDLETDVAHTAAEADLRALEKAYDLYLMDIRVPGRNGVEIARRFFDLRPSSRVIFMTAYETDDLFRMHPELAGWAVLKKPFQMSTVHEEIVRLLEYGGPRPGAADELEN